MLSCYRELKALPEGIHLLCPRQQDDDYGRYDKLDEVTEDGRSVKDLVDEATARKEKFLSCMRILAYNSDGVEELQGWVLNKLDETLEKCDSCIKHYYTGKVWLMTQLEADYQEDDIAEFSRRVDELDIKRITRNLTTATRQLKAVPPQKIALDSLDRAALLSIFETLSCEALLRNDDLLQQYFDEPFKLIQTKRTLKISDYVPAVTRFLFDPNQSRSFWALAAWARYDRPPTNEEFDWAIRDGLLSVLLAASQQPPQLAVVQRLWRGMQFIVRRLDKEQITHQLRALEIDPCRFSVDHLTIPTPGLRFLLTTIRAFLEKAPADFWDAMQTISPQAIVEHTLANSQFDLFLMQASEGEPFEKSALKDMLGWINPFLASLKGPHQPSACRAFVPLLTRFQDARYPTLSRYHCFHVGLTSLLQTLRSFTDHEASRGSVARVVLKDTMEVVSHTISIILKPPKFDIEEGRQDEIMSLCMDVVRNALALECQSLKSDYEVILKHGHLSHGVSTYSPPIWDAVIKNLHQDNISLSTAALLGIIPLVGLEKFPVKGEGNEERTNFNETYGRLIHLSCQIIERLADFSPNHVNTLFRNQDTCSALVSTLFAADLNTYQAAVDLMKNVSGQSARRDAIAYLLQSFMTTTLYGMSWSFRRISNMKTFSPAPRMLHTGTDIVEILCNTQTGMLRTRSLTDRREISSLQRLWEYLWQALATIFDETETWHVRGNDKSVMLEFCRETIQFADFLFDQYAVFLAAVEQADPGQKSAPENFLKPPTMTMSAMAKWLRLKDDYLATTLVGLVAKLLRRLGGLDVTTVKADALSYIEGVAVNGTVKTILTTRDKAELVRSLEAYYKKPVVTASTASLKKQSTITSFAKSSDLSLPPSHPSSRPPTSPSSHLPPSTSDDISDQTFLDLSRSVELNKQRVAGKPSKMPQPSVGPKAAPRPMPMSKPLPPPKPAQDESSILNFRQKREREKEAKKRRDLEQLALLKKNVSSYGVAGQTAEQGSGVRGIGIKGKDHSIPTESMMVSSGSESEDDDEDDAESDNELDMTLFNAKSEKPEAVSAYQKSKAQSLEQRPVRKVRRRLNEHDMSARLSSDLTRLHMAVLSWDYYSDRETPPRFDPNECIQVANQFASATEYQTTFEPLLKLEAWQSLQRSKEENQLRPFEVKIMTRVKTNDIVEFSTLPVGEVPKDVSLGDGDLVLFSLSKRPDKEPHPMGHVLARVDRVNRKGNKLEVNYRTAWRPQHKFLASIAPGFVAWGAKVTSLTPVEREFGSVMGLQYYDLCQEICLAKPSPILKYSENTLDPLIRNYAINLAQAKAIKSAYDNDGFTLIQGPPGSGKTKTIVALVGSLLTNTLRATSAIPIGPGNVMRGGTGKVLICAPSNAAVDELVMRLKKGVKTSDGREHKISVVRTGRGDVVNREVLDVTLDEMVDARLTQTSGPGKGVDPKMLDEYKEIKERYQQMLERFDKYEEDGLAAPPSLSNEFQEVKAKKTALSKKIDEARDIQKKASRDDAMDKRKLREAILNDAHVICTTLSGSGHDIFAQTNIEFDTVIVDEAAQCVELSALIPLKYGCRKCVLVGDPQQLPPTVLSLVAQKYAYAQSLFVRMQRNHKNDVHLLDTQYRMHPDISRFPRIQFYGGMLQDGPDMRKLRVRPWHKSHLFSPYRFFDVQGMHHGAAKGKSLVNQAEVEMAMRLYDRLIMDFGQKYDFDGQVGIITPYKGQLRELRLQFSRTFGDDIFKKVEFNTTDAFQGREKEIIIFSCVRAASKSTSIGFLADDRRLNVGLTRAKSSLWVLGNSQTLIENDMWGNLIESSKEASAYTDGDIVEMLERTQIKDDSDMDMVDDIGAESSNEIGMQDANGPTSGSTSNSRRPSQSIEAKSHGGSTMPAPGRNGPSLPLPDGPSGGKSGLDDTKACAICGSAEHFSHHCDNAAAKEASRGVCFRCGNGGHTQASCDAGVFCVKCGEFGHETIACVSLTTLPKHQRVNLARRERHFEEQVKQNAERRRQQQMGGHDRKVPTVQATTHTPPQKAEDRPSGKRKLVDGPTREAKAPRLATGPPANAPKGPKGAAAAGGGSGQVRPPTGPKAMVSGLNLIVWSRHLFVISPIYLDSDVPRPKARHVDESDIVDESRAIDRCFANLPGESAANAQAPDDDAEEETGGPLHSTKAADK